MFDEFLKYVNLNDVAVKATNAGDIDIVKIMLAKGATNYDGIMRHAGQFGYKDIVKLVIEKATNHAEVMNLAKENKHASVVTMIQDYIANHF